MAQYTLVTFDQVREVLRADKGWSEVQVPRAKERVLEFPLDVRAPGCVIRVYTGIPIGHNEGRGCGEDAIRVCVINVRTDRGVRKAARVHRVVNWRENLKKRILSVLDTFPKPLPRTVARTAPLFRNMIDESADDHANFGTV